MQATTSQPPRGTQFPFQVLLSATIRAFAVFVALDFMLEWAFEKIAGIRVKALLTHATFDGAFTTTYFAVIFLGLAGILTLYTIGRPLFKSRLRAALAVGIFVYLYTGLLMIQMLNLGLLSLELFVIIGITNSIELPAALAMGITNIPERPH